MTDFGTEEAGSIEALYAGGHSVATIASALRCSGKRVSLHLRQTVGLRSVTERAHNYEADDSFFDCIDTEAKAYWLGFLLADGSIAVTGKYKSTKVLILKLKRADRGHIEAFLRDLGSNHPIRDGNGGINNSPYSLLRITRKHLVESLQALGWEAFKKEGGTGILDQVPSHLLRHTLRGLIDGDGSICTSNTMLFFCDIHKTVVEWVLSKVRNTALSAANRRVMPNGKGKNCWKMVTTGNEARWAIDWLYSDCTVSLPRKMTLAQQEIARYRAIH